MTRLLWLSDDAWAAIDPHLPRGKPGKPRVDDRRVISGILHVLKTGCRWRDVPPEYGPATTIYNRYNRWSRRGFGGKPQAMSAIPRFADSTRTSPEVRNGP
jgi:transposase